MDHMNLDYASQPALQRAGGPNISLNQPQIERQHRSPEFLDPDLRYAKRRQFDTRTRLPHSITQSHSILPRYPSHSLSDTENNAAQCLMLRIRFENPSVIGH